MGALCQSYKGRSPPSGSLFGCWPSPVSSSSRRHGTVAALSVLGAVLGWTAHQAVSSASGDAAKPPADTVLRWIIEVLTFAGLAALFGTNGGLLALLCTVTPALVSKGWALRTSRRVPDSAAALSPEREAHGLTDRELCPAWRASFASLQSAAGVYERQRVAALRAGYLDEMEKRLY